MRGRKPLSIAKIYMGDVMVGAVATGNYDYQVFYDRKCAIEKAIMYMGFGDVGSYISQYPGRFLEDSVGTKHYCRVGGAHYDSPLGRYINLYCSVIHIISSKNSDNEDMIAVGISDFNNHIKRLLSGGMLGNGSFMLPLTTDEVKHSLGFTKVPKSEMWYCIDWKG